MRDLASPIQESATHGRPKTGRWSNVVVNLTNQGSRTNDQPIMLHTHKKRGRRIVRCPTTSTSHRHCHRKSGRRNQYATTVKSSFQTDELNHQIHGRQKPRIQGRNLHQAKSISKEYPTELRYAFSTGQQSIPFVFSHVITQPRTI